MIVEIDQESDFQKMYYDSQTEFLLINHDTSVKACLRAHTVYNYCTYSLCQSCWDEKITEVGGDGKPKRRKRSADSKNSKKVEGSVTPQSIKAKKCHHELHQLEDLNCLHWCAPEFVGKEVWFKRTTGCRSCEKMYVYCSGVGKIKKQPENWQGFSTVENNMDDYTQSRYKEWRKTSNGLFD
jgi:hypothetical protein